MSKIFESHKKVTATLMNRLDYVLYREWELPDDENGADEGYLVEYIDGGKPNHPKHNGYISWSPKEQFDNGYTEVTEQFSFGKAVELMRSGQKVARTGWNGSGMYTQLNDACDFEFSELNEFFTIKNVKNSFNTWVPSVSDILADDWVGVA